MPGAFAWTRCCQTRGPARKSSDPREGIGERIATLLGRRPRWGDAGWSASGLLSNPRTSELISLHLPAI